jgi:hypothetical protein
MLVTAPHDFYHLPAYVALSAGVEAGEPVGLYVAEGERAMLLPVLVRDLPPALEPGGARDAATPYGYPGPIFRGGYDPEFARRATAAMVDGLREHGVVALFARLHPILNRDTAPLAAAGMTIAHGETVSIDLTRSTEALWSDTMSGHRNEINRSIRAGHRAFVDEAWSHAADFTRIYAETMGRVGATSFYRFGDDYFRALREALGPRLHLGVVDIGGAIAAAALFSEVSGLVQYHLSGTAEAFLKERPTKLLLHHVRGWMKERGNTCMHLGGGLGGTEDSLFKFKAGFSKTRQAFHTWRVIVDRERYAALAARAGWPLAEGDDASGFFPRYRRPAAEAR